MSVPDLTDVGGDLGAGWVDDALSGIVLEQEDVIALALAHHVPVDAMAIPRVVPDLLALHHEAVPQAFRAAQGRARGNSRHVQAKAVEFDISLWGGTHLGGGRILDDAGTAQIAPDIVKQRQRAHDDHRDHDDERGGRHGPDR